MYTESVQTPVLRYRTLTPEVRNVTRCDFAAGARCGAPTGTRRLTLHIVLTRTTSNAAAGA